jgi:hypothetical protein
VYFSTGNMVCTAGTANRVDNTNCNPTVLQTLQV